MAEIFLARATSVGGVERYVVLKRVLPERSRDPTFARMFLDEARLAAQLHHPNIAQVHDIGRLGESFFFTMEYVHGEDLRALLQRLAALRRMLPIQHALHIAAGAAAGLHHAHERTGADRQPLNIVHRDVSPSNVMVSFEGAVKLVDFGVAKAAHRTSETRTGTVKGKIAYLSPEQCKGSGLDRRSDIFSLGIVMYELLTCTRLFRRGTDFETMTTIVTEEAPPPSRIRPEISAGLDHILMTALQKDPNKRFRTAGEMLEAIEEVATRDSKTMSATGMGRFLKELFGERPEPWIELHVRDDQPSIVTVTSQSIVELGDVLAAAAQLKPAGPAPMIDQRSAAEDVEAELRRTLPLRKTEPDGELDLPAPSSPPPPPLPNPYVAPVAAPPIGGPTPPTLVGHPPPAMPLAPHRPSTGSIPPPLTGPGSGSSPSLAARQSQSGIPALPPNAPLGPTALAPGQSPYPSTYPVLPTSESTSYKSGAVDEIGALRPSRRRWVGIVLGAAITIGIGIGVFVATRDPKSPAVEPPPETEPDEIATPVATPDAAIAAAVVTADAAVAVTAIDAAATPVVEDKPPDKPPDKIPTPPPSRDALIMTAARKGNWNGVIKHCDDGGTDALAAETRKYCAIAACKADKRDKAQAYADDLPEKLKKQVTCLKKKKDDPVPDKKCDPKDVLAACNRNPTK
jgi:serine/threonine protein kinase